MINNLLIAPVILPLIASILALCWSRRGAQLALMSTVGGALIATVLLLKVQPQGEIQLALGGWQSGLGISLYADSLSAIMLLMCALVSLAATIYANSYFAQASRAIYFWPLWLLLQTSLAALLVSADLFNIYVGLELLGLSAVALTALGQGRAASKSALQYLLIGLSGSMVFLAGVALMYGRYGVLDIGLLAELLEADLATQTALALITVSLLLKCALFPIHFWLPAVHSSAPAPVSAALSALVVKIAFYLLLRLWIDLFQPVASPAMLEIIGVLGAAAILWGGWLAMNTERLKLLAAYSTISQMGYLFLFMSILFSLPAGADRDLLLGALILFAITHGFAKGGLFLAVGIVQQQAGHDRISELDGAAKALPLTLFALALCGIALIGLPPSGGFTAKWLLVSEAMLQGMWHWVLVIAVGSLMACVYIFRVLGHAFSSGDSVGIRINNRSQEFATLVLAISSTLILGLAGNSVWNLLNAQGEGVLL